MQRRCTVKTRAAEHERENTGNCGGEIFEKYRSCSLKSFKALFEIQVTTCTRTVFDNFDT